MPEDPNQPRSLKEAEKKSKLDFDFSWLPRLASKLRGALRQNTQEEAQAIAEQSDVAWRESIARLSREAVLADQTDHADESMSGIFDVTVNANNAVDTGDAVDDLYMEDQLDSSGDQPIENDSHSATPRTQGIETDEKSDDDNDDDDDDDDDDIDDDSEDKIDDVDDNIASLHDEIKQIGENVGDNDEDYSDSDSASEDAALCLDDVAARHIAFELDDSDDHRPLEVSRDYSVESPRLSEESELDEGSARAFEARLSRPYVEETYGFGAFGQEGVESLGLFHANQMDEVKESEEEFADFNFSDEDVEGVEGAEILQRFTPGDANEVDDNDNVDELDDEDQFGDDDGFDDSINSVDPEDLDADLDDHFDADALADVDAVDFDFPNRFMTGSIQSRFTHLGTGFARGSHMGPRLRNTVQRSPMVVTEERTYAIDAVLDHTYTPDPSPSPIDLSDHPFDEYSEGSDHVEVVNLEEIARAEAARAEAIRAEAIRAEAARAAGTSRADEPSNRAPSNTQNDRSNEPRVKSVSFADTTIEDNFASAEYNAAAVRAPILKPAVLHMPIPNRYTASRYPANKPSSSGPSSSRPSSSRPLSSRPSSSGSMVSAPSSLMDYDISGTFNPKVARAPYLGFDFRTCSNPTSTREDVPVSPALNGTFEEEEREFVQSELYTEDPEVPREITLDAALTGIPVSRPNDTRDAVESRPKTVNAEMANTETQNIESDNAASGNAASGNAGNVSRGVALGHLEPRSTSMNNRRWNLFNVGFTLAADPSQEQQTDVQDSSPAAAEELPQVVRDAAQDEFALMARSAHRFMAESSLFGGNPPKKKELTKEPVNPELAKQNLEKELREATTVAKSLFSESPLFGGILKRKRSEAEVSTQEDAPATATEQEADSTAAPSDDTGAKDASSAQDQTTDSVTQASSRQGTPFSESNTDDLTEDSISTESSTKRTRTTNQRRKVPMTRSKLRAIEKEKEKENASNGDDDKETLTKPRKDNDDKDNVPPPKKRRLRKRKS